jgi:hypothetical protein
VVNTMLWLLYPQEKDPITASQEVAWFPQMV